MRTAPPRLVLFLVLFAGSAVFGAEAPLADDAVLDWNGSELVAGAGALLRHWKLADGLPSATGVDWNGQEWITPENRPTTSLPNRRSLTPPLRIAWRSESGPANPVEAPSRRGELTVIGSDGVGYRWHLKVFAHCPAVLCRLEMIGAEGAPPPENLDTGGARSLPGIESATLARPGNRTEVDLLERFFLRPAENQLTVVNLTDQTDHEDNLAAEQVWRLSPKGKVEAATNLFSIDDPIAGRGLAVLKLEALPHARPVPSPRDVLGEDRHVTVYGHGAGTEGRGCEWAVLGYSGGRWGRAIALHQLQRSLREFKPGRDGVMVSNTWGDRSQDARVSESFVAEEIRAGSALGVDVCQIDDGWQKGITKNSAVSKKAAAWQGGFWDLDPKFWEPRPTGFPRGMESTAQAARSHGMGLGLWFSPDGAQDYGHWERDAAAVLGFYRRWGVHYVKIDGTHLSSKLAEANLRQFIDRVLQETGGAVSFDLDVTADIRPGYFGMVEAGPLFLENRYTDNHSWWPHATLRNVWQLAWYLPPQRLRVEFLNATRNAARYAGDPLAPANYPADTPLAMTLVANPLAWFEVSHLPPAVAAPVKALISTWKVQRNELQGGTVLPIGDCPSGAAWTGFCSISPHSRQVLVFREMTPTDATELELPETKGEWQVSPIAGSGGAAWKHGRLAVRIPSTLRYLWVRLSEPAGR